MLIVFLLILLFDVSYRNSTLRKGKYYVNKKDVTRTITTIIGEITITRTYYEDKSSKQKFFYIDELLNLPKYDHYDPVVKGLAIKESFYSNQSQAGRIIGERIAKLTRIQPCFLFQDKALIIGLKVGMLIFIMIRINLLLELYISWVMKNILAVKT